MPYVKLDAGILDSTLWMERGVRDIFITALLLAEPREFTEPVQQIAVKSLDYTGFEVPAGWYGFVPAAGIGIINRAKIPLDEGFAALEKLGAEDDESRSHAFDGRRMIRIDGGYLILNYVTYRDKDHTTAERSRRYREKLKAKKRHAVSSQRHAVTTRDITEADADADADAYGATNTLDSLNNTGNTHTASSPLGDAETPVVKPQPSGVRVMPMRWTLTSEQRNTADLVLLASPPGIVSGLTSGTITPVHRTHVITAAKREAQEHGVSPGEALNGLLDAVQHQAASVEPERLRLFGGMEKYFSQAKYRMDPIHVKELRNGASKGAGTIAAVHAVLAKDRAKELARLGGDNGSAAGMLALAGRARASQG